MNVNLTLDNLNYINETCASIQDQLMIDDEMFYDPFKRNANINIWFMLKHGKCSNIKYVGNESVNNKITKYKFNLNDDKKSASYCCAGDELNNISWITEYLNYANLEDIMKQVHEQLNSAEEDSVNSTIEGKSDESETVINPGDKLTKEEFKKLHSYYLLGFKLVIFEMIKSFSQIYFTTTNLQVDPIIPVTWTTNEKNERDFLGNFKNTYNFEFRINSKELTRDAIAWESAYPVLTLLLSTPADATLVMLEIKINEEKKEIIGKNGRQRIIKIPNYCNVKLFFIGNIKSINNYLNGYFDYNKDIIDNVIRFKKGDNNFLLPANKRK